MKQHRRKPHSRKRFTQERRNAGESRHWLGEGSVGQESLMLEIEAMQYFSDQALARTIVSHAHRCKRGTEKPFAVLVAPDGCIGWQLSSLCKYYNVYLCSSGAEDILDQAVSAFGVQAISSDFSKELEHYIDLFVFTESNWENEAAYVDALMEASEQLSDEGQVCTILRGTREDGGISILWSAGDRSALEPSLTRKIPAKCSVHSSGISAGEAGDLGRVNAFLKRNRAYFGKAVRELLYQRIREEDFIEGLGEPGELAMFLSWDFG